MEIKREWLEDLMFTGAASRRFTQDSPVLPDVWLEYMKWSPQNRAHRVDLIITPHRNSSAPDLALALIQRLDADKDTAQWKEWHGTGPLAQAGLAYHQSAVVVKASFAELVRDILPMSEWWRDTVPDRSGNLLGFLESTAGRKRVITALRELSRDPSLETEARETTPARKSPRRKVTAPLQQVSPGLLWMIRVVGTVLVASRHELQESEDARAAFFTLSRQYADVVEAFSALLKGMPSVQSGSPAHVWMVSRNRTVAPSIARSVLAMKGDAARRLFEVDTRNIAWAILDGGLDARHPAFRKPDKKSGARSAKAFELGKKPANSRWENNTTVARTFDFSRIRNLLSPAQLDEGERVSEAPGHTSAKLSAGKTGTKRPAFKQANASQLIDLNTLETSAHELTQRLLSGRAIDWDELIPLLEVPHDDTYIDPVTDHGTHVAGILAGDWKKKDWPDTWPPDERDDLVGVCPGLTLYDFRVMGDSGEGDEFTVMAALQFIRHLNAHRDQPAIHGANLSLSLKHDVANYACGRTPVCDECDRLVSSGVVVVAAAGNDGYMKFTTPRGDSEGYRNISISDPGNAESVITVGATHRHAPHTYGVSYFSSRGPTGDGRVKPDLVAPGEKIVAPVLRDAAGTKDGTSMAAPHVSGAAVLLMARHRELLGNPARVKQILCDTATDLGRERYFQGAGMVDILRALQSV